MVATPRSTRQTNARQPIHTAIDPTTQRLETRPPRRLSVGDFRMMRIKSPFHGSSAPNSDESNEAPSATRPSPSPIQPSPTLGQLPGCEKTRARCAVVGGTPAPHCQWKVARATARPHGFSISSIHRVSRCCVGPRDPLGAGGQRMRTGRLVTAWARARAF
jgi:hypothetical protein